MSVISAGTTSDSSIKFIANSDGTLTLKTNDNGSSGGTTALTLAANQAATFASTVNATTAFSVGSSIATTGEIRLKVGQSIVYRNVGNTVDLNLVSIGSGNILTFGGNDQGHIYHNVATGQAHYKQVNGVTVTTTSSTGLLVGTTSSTAGYALKVGGASANILILADSPNGATLLCDSATAGAKGAFFGHITTVSQAQVRCGASGGVYLSDGATSWTAISDERQKTDLVPITDALVKVSSLRAVTGRYVWDEKRRAFLIAQEVQQVLPEAVDVADDADGTLGLAYTDVIPLLVASIKELNAKVAALESK